MQATGGQINQVWICGDYIVRLNFQANQQLHNEARLLQEIPAAIPRPKVIASGHDVQGEWQLQQKVAGRPLAHLWAEMSVDLRKQAIHQLATILQTLHGFDHKNLTTPRPAYQPLDSALPEQIIAFAMQAKAFPHMDVALMDQVILMTRGFAQKISSAGRWGIVHNDLHFENILWDGEKITALLDFERACYGPLDLELDLLLRYCRFPALFVHEEYEHLIHPEAYSLVPQWLHEEYPSLFTVEHLTERLSLYSLFYDLRLLQRFPPHNVVDPDEDDHLINRIRAIIEQRSYISTLVQRIRA